MSTKFVLHGGFSKGSDQENDNFTKEILKDAPEKIELLLVYFAEEPEKIPLRMEQDTNHFNKNKGIKEIEFEIADEKIFEDQVKKSNVIYLHGGKSFKILEILKKFPNLKEMFDGKIIAGDSAGANVLSKGFYSKSADKIFEGMGLIPFYLICHYSAENKNKLNELSKHYDNSEILVLKEYEYKFFTI